MKLSKNKFFGSIDTVVSDVERLKMVIKKKKGRCVVTCKLTIKYPFNICHMVSVVQGLAAK